MWSDCGVRAQPGVWEAQGALFCLPGLSHMTLDNEGFLSQPQPLNLLKGPGGSAHIVGLVWRLKNVWQTPSVGFGKYVVLH